MSGKEVVVVTGCDSGFGKNAALKFAKLGYCVVAGCFTKEGCEKIEKEAGGETHGFLLDVTSDDSVKKFATEVEKVLNGPEKARALKGVVNNAGIAPTGFVEWADLQDLQKAMEINVYGQIRIVKALLPKIRASKGRIVNVSSICGVVAYGGAPWYSCTKYAVEGWTDSLRREMMPFGVSVSIVEPGFFKTNMVNMEQYEKVLNKQFTNLPGEAKEAYGEVTLKGYIDNVAEQIEQFADPDTSKVIDAMVHGITSRFPKARYAVGGSAKLLFLPISYLPTFIADNVLAGLNKRYKPSGGGKGFTRPDLSALWALGMPVCAAALYQTGSSLSSSLMLATGAALFATSCLA